MSELSSSLPAAFNNATSSLYSGQQQLQRRQLQQMQNNKDNEGNKQRPPGAISFVPPNLYRTSLLPQDSNDPWTGAWGLKGFLVKTRCTKETMQDKQQQQQQQQQPSERDYFAHNHHASTQDRLKCFDRIHALESDAEPLINNASAHRIIRRNAIIVLSHAVSTTFSKRQHYEHALTDEPSALFHGSSVPADMNIASTTSESPVVGAIKEPNL
ncbi:hypothetical protein O0I10_004779 [Lichtheimia ornata]|uniref:Uncharacterized protein n=1 Tax=Lichtheimia ornata TaxID=688661 RepID=A0AAD7V6I2_9FUNG|nr:uncharacterized protein O0I10_004779 [Lichtheimia ornata]KAJ8659416.1 hypothetical protein O0I10_004779 [Lichtheimia ornata]